MKLEYWLGGVCIGAGVLSLFWNSAAAASIFIVGGLVLIALANIRSDIHR